jgi:hypothetical protein
MFAPKLMPEIMSGSARRAGHRRCTQSVGALLTNRKLLAPAHHQRPVERGEFDAPLRSGSSATT